MVVFVDECVYQQNNKKLPLLKINYFNLTQKSHRLQYYRQFKLFELAFFGVHLFSAEPLPIH